MLGLDVLAVLPVQLHTQIDACFGDRTAMVKLGPVSLQGFLQLRLTGETTHLDVDTLNERLQVSPVTLLP